MKKGFLITFEGIDGSGKSTQARKLQDFLRQNGIEALLFREPGGTPEGEKIREILLDKKSNLTPKSELFLFLASRNILTNHAILPSLEEGKWVIVDRYADSSVAYQGYGRGVDLELVHKGNQEATEGLKPDLTFYIDVTAEEAMKRKRTRDRMEVSGNFLEKVRKGYLEMVNKEERMVYIDGMRSVEEVWREIKEAVVKRLLGGEIK